MDEFKDLDKELSRLREELEFQDEWGKGMHFPSEGDYWRKRLEEEKHIWSRKMNNKDDEKKYLQEKLLQQKAQIEEYNGKLKDLEKKFEDDVRRWEERLKSKEMDLVMEKNRLMSEEKVKEAEIETRSMQEKISDLNAKIGEIKDQELKERSKIYEDFSHERSRYEEKIKLYNDQIVVLKGRIYELEENLRHKITEYDKICQDYDQKIKETKHAIEDLGIIKETLNKEKEGLNEELTNLKQKDEQEKNEMKSTFAKISQNFLRNVNSYLGPVFALVNLIIDGKVTKSSWRLVRDAVQRTENELDLFVINSDLERSYSNLFTLAAILPNQELPFWKNMAERNSFKIKILDNNHAKDDVLKSKPQILVISSQYLKTAKKIRKLWPFIPIIIYGDVEAKASRKLESKGFIVVGVPCLVEEVSEIVNKAGNHSVAWPEFWNDLKIKKSHANPVLVFSFLFLSVIAGYFIRKHYLAAASYISSYDVVYSKPTNIAFDGEYIWICDWFGQSIYKHKPGKKLELVKIFHFPEKHITTISWINGYLWSADPWNKKIYKHNLDENLTILDSYPISGISPSAICGYNNKLWSCDASKGEIYLHDIEKDLKITATYKSPGTSPSGLFFDGEKLWSLDSHENRIYRHNMDGDLTVEHAYLPPNYEQKGFNLSGISGDRDKVWICSEKMGRIFEYSKDNLLKVK
ncbi:MAG: hypothetical protein JW871_00090 [Endomicrobiales bacterium]|nr:hypothetical protein [Endomicrobiales bacterium]